MSTINRVLDADVQVHHLTKDDQLLDSALLTSHGRTARTLVKEGPLRLTMMQLGAGGTLPSHSTDAFVTIHLIAGEVTFSARNSDHALKPGDVLVLRPGVEHSARSATGGVFLLTILFQGVVPPEPPLIREEPPMAMGPDGSHLVVGVDGGQ